MHEPVETRRVEQTLRQRLPQRAPDEVLLPLDAPEGAARIGMPAAALEELGVAAAHVGQRLVAVQLETARLQQQQARDLVPHRAGDVDLHAADGVDEPLEALEVDLGVMGYRDVEVLGDRLDELL